MSMSGRRETYHGYEQQPLEPHGVVDPPRPRRELIPELPREREFDESWWGTAKPARRIGRHADGPARPIWRFVLATLLILTGVVILGLSWWTQGR